jgi:hypothetical protein
VGLWVEAGDAKGGRALARRQTGPQTSKPITPSSRILRLRTFMESPPWWSEALANIREPVFPGSTAMMPPRARSQANIFSIATLLNTKAFGH